MLVPLLGLLFSATAVFQGTATCEKMADGVSVELAMNVESKETKVPSDSISNAMTRLFSEIQRGDLKSLSVSVMATQEWQNRPSSQKQNEPTTFIASKNIKLSSKNFQEMQTGLQIAADHGFLMQGSQRYYIDAMDSLNNSCLEKATKNAISRAETAMKALRAKSMTIEKITDSDKFDLYTSDDTKSPGKPVDEFFTKESAVRPYAARGRVGLTSSAMFYKLLPQPIVVNSSVKLLVDIKTNE